MTATKIKVLGIVGSQREASYTGTAVRAALEGAAQAGADVEVLEIRDLNLPFVETTVPDEKAPEAVRRLREKVRQADALVIGTPEYHGGMSGALKNALDWLTGAEIADKMVGLVGVSGGALGANEAMNQVRTTLRSLHAWTLPEQAGVPSAWKSIDGAGTVRDPQLAERLRRVGQLVVRHASVSRLAAAA